MFSSLSVGDCLALASFTLSVASVLLARGRYSLISSVSPIDLTTEKKQGSSAEEFTASIVELIVERADEKSSKLEFFVTSIGASMHPVCVSEIEPLSSTMRSEELDKAVEKSLTKLPNLSRSLEFIRIKPGAKTEQFAIIPKRRFPSPVLLAFVIISVSEGKLRFPVWVHALKLHPNSDAHTPPKNPEM